MTACHPNNELTITKITEIFKTKIGGTIMPTIMPVERGKIERGNIKVGSREIGDGCPTYIIAEAGINHNGNMEAAFELIRAAAGAGADAVKFQKRHLESIYPEEVLYETYRFEESFQYLIPILKKCELSLAAHSKFKSLCDELGVDYICTPFDTVSANRIMTLAPVAYKIASCDLTNLELLEAVARFGQPMFVSTGMSTMEEIETAYNYLSSFGAEFVFLHCRSAYPVWPRDVHLKMITTLKNRFRVHVGYSGHDIGTTIPLVAASMGACIVEKHITLDKSMDGPDHKISLTPDELKILVRDIRVADQAMTDPSRFLLRGEILNRDVFRYKGKEKKSERPETMPELDHVPVGNWGLISRPHEKAEGNATERNVIMYNPSFIEFHLTRSDLNPGSTENTGGREPLKDKIIYPAVVHAPEYVNNKLADLCSGDDDIRNQSVWIIKETIKWASYNLFNHGIGVKLVFHAGAMSMNTELKRDRLMNNLERSIDEIDDYINNTGAKVILLPENLPPYPWYFGGQWKGNLFMDPNEIASFCESNLMGMCFDLSHAALWCNATETSLSEYIKTVSRYISHVHVSDAYGLDGEGVQIGDGDIDFELIKQELVTIVKSCTWVPEIWRGHLYSNSGAIEALNRINKIIGKGAKKKVLGEYHGGGTRKGG